MAGAFLEPLHSMFNVIEGSINITAPTGILLFGLVTGLRHSLEADHVAAILSMVASDRKNIRRTSILGAMWGIGHTASLFVAGLLVLLFAVNISGEISSKMEFGVGIMLLFLAITAFTGLNVGKFLKGLIRHDLKHRHLHYHDEMFHSHNHVHEKEHNHTHKSLIVGMIHGMAGSGALMLIVLSTINSVPLGLAYIAIFGAGSIAGMVGISTLIGIPFIKLRNSVKFSLIIRYVAATTTLIIGAALIYNLVWVQHIFLQ